MAKQVQEMAKPKKMNMQQVLTKVKLEIVQLTSLPFNTIVGVAVDDETQVPTVMVELVERRAIPDSMDLLGLYEVITDDTGNVQTFRRVGMRKRGDAVSSSEY
jgi:hypothetical protein